MSRDQAYITFPWNGRLHGTFAELGTVHALENAGGANKFWGLQRLIEHITGLRAGTYTLRCNFNPFRSSFPHGEFGYHNTFPPNPTLSFPLDTFASFSATLSPFLSRIFRDPARGHRQINLLLFPISTTILNSPLPTPWPPLPPATYQANPPPPLPPRAPPTPAQLASLAQAVSALQHRNQELREHMCRQVGHPITYEERAPVPRRCICRIPCEWQTLKHRFPWCPDLCENDCFLCRDHGTDPPLGWCFFHSYKTTQYSGDPYKR